MDALKTIQNNFFCYWFCQNINWYLYQGVSLDFRHLYTHFGFSYDINILWNLDFPFPTIETFFQLREIKKTEKTYRQNVK